MNNLKKLKLLVASALLSSTAVYADDCTDTSATNCGITISGNQTIDIDSSISTTDEKGINITNGSNTLTIDGNITTTTGTENAAMGIRINSVNAENNIINMTGDIETITNGSATNANGIAVTNSASNNTVNITGNISTSGNTLSGILIRVNANNNNITLTGDINITGATNAFGVRILGTDAANSSSDNVITVNGNINTVWHSIDIGDYAKDNNIVVNGNVQSTGGGAVKISVGSTNNVVVVNGNLTTTATSESPTIQIFDQATDNLIIIDGNVTQLANQAAVNFGSAGGTTSNDNTISITGQITSAQDGIVFSRSDHNEVFVSGGIDAVRNAISADSNSDNNIVYLDRNARIEGAIVNNGTNNTLIFTGWQPIDGDGNTDIDGDVDFEEVVSSQSQYGLATSSNYTVSGSTPWVVRANVAQPVLVSNTYIKTMGVANIDDEGNRLYLRTTKINQNLTERTRAYARNEVEPYWMNVYTTKSERDEDFKEIHQNARGVTIGGQLSQFNKPIDLIFNLVLPWLRRFLTTQHRPPNKSNHNLQ